MASPLFSTTYSVTPSGIRTSAMSTIFEAPVDEYIFLLHEVLPVSTHLEGMSAEDSRAILEQASRFLGDVWAPLDSVGDLHGCELTNGTVTTPPGFKEAYRAFCDAGWNSVTAPSELGGAALPELIGTAIREFAASANNSLGLYSGLTNGAHATLSRTGSPWMKEHVVPRMVEGRWTGTMCLTEPHCGTDLRLMKTKATAQADGTFRVSGTKIFISGGDHDLADNVIHLVLAKIPDASGKLLDDLSTINLFMVAKIAVDSTTGELQGPNGVTPGGVETKMGLKGNATCVMHFEEAVAYRLGQSSSAADRRTSAGMSGMFDMMNGARLGTGLQAIASAHRAFRHSLHYAHERVAGRAAASADRSGGAADPIVCHPDVRRLIAKQAAFIESARALILYVRSLLDEPDSTQRAVSVSVGSMLTPVIKAYLSDRSFESANDAMQVLGGHGYIRDNGVEQCVRDARIFQLYEGANGVQAFDLVARKLGLAGGRAFDAYLELVRRDALEAATQQELVPLSNTLLQALERVGVSKVWFGAPERNPYDAGGSSYDFLTMLGIFACGHMWLLMAVAAARGVAKGEKTEYYKRKLALAEYWFKREMPMIQALAQRVSSGAACLMTKELVLR